ncbi:MAG: hypothetical protein H5T84_06540, partial [Thermoleophilia bacterium]|nr:hypothetical protein [Thermoleophilia bacterium]
CYYGSDTAERMLRVIERRGLKLLGVDGQGFLLPGGRVAFVFSTEAADQAARPVPLWSPYDIEGFAMSMARKVCERLVDGQRMDCVVGWSCVPADGLDADDLLAVAEAGAQRTDAFRRVAGGPVGMRSGATRRGAVATGAVATGAAISNTGVAAG